jgi:filamentous hemagglutinin family protein
MAGRACPATTHILGNLRANSQIFVLNRNSVLFGSTAQVHAAAWVQASWAL